MRFFLDNNVSPHLADALLCLGRLDGDEIEHLRKRFPPDTSDVVWIAKLGSESSWTLVSGDQRIRTRREERAAFLAAKLTTFFLAHQWVQARLWTQAEFLFFWWPTIRDFASKTTPGSVYEVPFGRKGKIKPLAP